MERECNVGRGYVELEAILPMAVKPCIASIGGFSVIDKKTGKCITFDWESYFGGANVDYDNNKYETLKMDWDLRNFDYDFFEGQCLAQDILSSYINQDRLNELAELDNNNKLEEFLTSCELDEVHYECFTDMGEETFIPMKLKSFSIGDYEFSKEQINKYNKKMFKEEKDFMITNINRLFEDYSNQLEKEVI